MISLVAMLAATVTALMITVKTLEASLPQNPTGGFGKWFNDNIAIFNLLLSIVLGVGGAFIQLSSTPNLFTGDPTFITNNPQMFAFVAGLVSVLPGGTATSLLSALLAWMNVKAGAQAVVVATDTKRSLLWG